jgi:hypothetical protein
MKHLFFIIALTALLASCKKDKTSAESTSPFKKNLVTVTVPGQSDWNMLYANDQKLLSFSNNEMKVAYKPGVPFSAKKTQSGFVHEYQNAVQDAQGRIIKLDRYSSGALIAKQEFKYNAEGYLIEHTMASNSSNHFVKYVYEYLAGNLTTVSAYEGGFKTALLVFQYDTNMGNPIKIDLFDFKEIQFVTDSQFGKQSKNLVKNAKLIAGNGQTIGSFDFSYTTDADGYIKTITQSIVGHQSIVYTCSFQ